LAKKQNSCEIIERLVKSYPFYAAQAEQYCLRWQFDTPPRDRLDLSCQPYCGSHVRYLSSPSGCSTCDLEESRYGIPPSCSEVCFDQTHAICTKKREEGNIVWGCLLSQRTRLHAMIRKMLMAYHNTYLDKAHPSFSSNNIVVPVDCLSRQ